MDKKHVLRAIGLALLFTLITTLLVSANPFVVFGPNFEIDGDLVVNEGADDWTSVIPGDGFLILDGSSGPKAVVEELNIFAKGGKFADPTTWKIEPGNSPAQNDLTNIYIYPVIEGEDGNSWMVMGMERIKKQGTFDLDFEYNQVGWDGSSGTLVRTPGDISVGFELSGNPEDPSADLQIVIIIYKPGVDCLADGWVGDYGGGWCEAFRGNGDELALSDYGYATMNAEPIAQGPWGSYDSSGAQLDPADQISPFFFAEAAINLTALEIEPSCPGFGSVHAKSRSSLEITADLKDLAGPQALPVNCWIEGYKYLDVNGNGEWDEGEDPLEGWTINLSGVASATTTTDENGHYIFENLADGTYTVSEECPVETPPWFQTEPENGDPDCGDDTYTFVVDIDNRSHVGDFGNGAPNILVEKTCPADVFLGDDIEYEITVTNTGNTNLYDVELVDSILGIVASDLDLVPEESQTFYPTKLADELGDVDNEVTATGDYPEFGAPTFVEVSSSADCTTTVWGLTVDKTVNEFYTRYFHWDITKSVDPDNWQLFDGESGTSEYTVELISLPYTENDWEIEGTITVDNPAPIEATLDDVTDMENGSVGSIPVTCASLTVPAEGSLECTFDSGPQNSLDNNPFGNLNTATATLINNNSGTTDFTGTAPINFGEAVVELIDEEVSVSDTFIGSTVGGTWSSGNTWTYTRTFACSEDVGQHDNTASFEANDTTQAGSDDASVTVECYDLNVTKTAQTFYTRYFHWDITKEVTPPSWDLFSGEEGTSDYTVFLDQTGFTEDDWQVKGAITITNNHPTRAADITAVVDDAGGFTGAVDCFGETSVPANDFIMCAYDTGQLSSPDSNPFGDTNTATATQQLYNFDETGADTPDGTMDYDGTAAIDFGSATVELVDEEVSVSDTYTGDLGTYTDDETFTYSRTFTCNGDEGTHGNTASFITNDTLTEGSDDASVTVSCYDLSMSKTAMTSMVLTYDWYIEKWVDNPGPIVVLGGESVNVHYTIEVGLTGDPVASDFYVWGTVKVNNSHPTRAADLTGIVDNISGFGAPDNLNCSSLIVPADSYIECTYNSYLPDWSARTNYATATQQLYSFDSSESATPFGTKDYNTNIGFDFTDPTLYHVDEMVSVNDPMFGGFLGTVHAIEDQPLPKYFEFDKTITAPELFCGEFTIDNTATFTTNDTQTSGSADASVIISVPCEGCTPGFWQGGSGSVLWDQVEDPDWEANNYATQFNPFIHTTLFNDFFNADPTDPRLNGYTMYALVSSGGGSDPAVKAARDMVAAYLNESAFPETYPADSIEALLTMWYESVAGGDAALDAFHIEVSEWNSPEGGYCPLP